MQARRTIVRLFRPLLLILAIIGLAYLAGGFEALTPGSFAGSLLVTIIAGLTILLFFGAIRSGEHRHLGTVAQLHRRSVAHQRHHDPPMPFYANQSMLPPGYNTRPETPERVLGFTRRVFRNRDMMRK